MNRLHPQTQAMIDAMAAHEPRFAGTAHRRPARGDQVRKRTWISRESRSTKVAVRNCLRYFVDALAANGICRSHENIAFQLTAGGGASGRRIASIYRKRCAGHERRLIARQIENGGRDLISAAEASQWVALEHFLRP